MSRQLAQNIAQLMHTYIQLLRPVPVSGIRGGVYFFPSSYYITAAGEKNGSCTTVMIHHVREVEVFRGAECCIRRQMLQVVGTVYVGCNWGSPQFNKSVIPKIDQADGHEHGLQ